MKSIQEDRQSNTRPASCRARQRGSSAGSLTFDRSQRVHRWDWTAALPWLATVMPARAQLGHHGGADAQILLQFEKQLH